ncbi:MAG: SPOR domain-containing protein [Gammaproteobacteria bacterium]|nr:SPOR domain-containing protein [Gammaproteobacteria bacterium]
MVKDYANLNSQSLKATVVPAKRTATAARNPASNKVSTNKSSRPLPILGAIVTIILAAVLLTAIVTVYKHRDALVAAKEKLGAWVGELHHSTKGKAELDHAGRLSMDQSLSDPTQSMAAGSNQQTLNLPANVNLNAVAPPPPAPKKKSKPAPVQAPQPVFDFYTVLPSGSANNAGTNGATSSAQPTPPPSTTPANSAAAAKFVVDVGYYQDQQSANQMRAQLLLMGLTPTVKNTGTLTSPVYQAELGPFDNITQANQVRQQLQAGGVSNIVVHPATN